MQKLILFVLILNLLNSTLIAGEFSAIGMKIGYNSSKFIGKDIPGKGVSSQPGFALGGFLSYKISNRFSLQQEVLLSFKGAKINTIGDVYLSNIFIYFGLPLLAKINFRAGSTIRPAILFGPSLGIKLEATNDVGILNDIRKIDFGIALGAGIETWKISLDARYISGMVNFD